MSEESGRIRNSSITTRSRRADTLRPGNSRDSFQKRFARASDRFANQAEDFDIGEALQEKCFPLPPVCKRPRLRFHSLRTYALN